MDLRESLDMSNSEVQALRHAQQALKQAVSDAESRGPRGHVAGTLTFETKANVTDTEEAAQHKASVNALVKDKNELDSFASGRCGVGSVMEARIMAEIATALRVGIGDVRITASETVEHLGDLKEVGFVVLGRKNTKHSVDSLKEEIMALWRDEHSVWHQGTEMSRAKRRDLMLNVTYPDEKLPPETQAPRRNPMA